MEGNTKVVAGCRYRFEWLKGKPAIVAHFATAPVMAADECFNLLQACIGELAIPIDLQPQKVDEWLRLYMDHRSIPNAIVDQFLEKLDSLFQVNEIELAAFLIGDACTIGDVNFLDDSFWRSAFERIEVRFFFRIWMPCVLVYGESPVKLLQSVGRGGPHEWDNVEKLVALDPLIVQHRRFGRLLNCVDANQRQERAGLLGECLGKAFPRPSKRQVKAMLAAYMSRVSEVLGQRFTEPEIRALFDAIAKDRGHGLRDTDLPESPEAFAKSIQRYRPFWQLPGSPDKDIQKAVRALEGINSLDFGHEFRGFSKR
jgi:hypothetical protein